MGDVANGMALCAEHWHVCRGTEPAFATITYGQANAFPGCYAYDAAQDNDVCHPDCSSNIGSVDSAANLDMAGMGATCRYHYVDHRSCMTQGGRIDASENDGTGCNYSSAFSGVICCQD